MAHVFLLICERARCSPDSPLTAGEIAERCSRFTGVRVTATIVDLCREDYRERMRRLAGLLEPLARRPEGRGDVVR